MKGMLIVDASRSLDAVRDALMETREAPLRKGHANDWNLEGASSHHCIGKIILCARSPVTPKITSASDCEVSICKCSPADRLECERFF